MPKLRHIFEAVLCILILGVRCAPANRPPIRLKIRLRGRLRIKVKHNLCNRFQPFARLSPQQRATTVVISPLINRDWSLIRIRLRARRTFRSGNSR